MRSSLEKASEVPFGLQLPLSSLRGILVEHMNPARWDDLDLQIDAMSVPFQLDAPGYSRHNCWLRRVRSDDFGEQVLGRTDGTRANRSRFVGIPVRWQCQQLIESRIALRQPLRRGHVGG